MLTGRIRFSSNYILFVALADVDPTLCCLVANAPSSVVSSLINLLCSCAFNSLSNSAKEIVEKSLVFSKVVMVASYISGTVTRIYSTILESENSDLKSLTLFAILRSLSE